MESAARRIEAIDTVRGGVMVLMALDHVRDFIHRGAMSFSPTDLTQTTPILFLTRWVTHVCAPTFMFTAGLGAFLWGQRGKTRPELSAYLVSRGLWLIVLEVTVMRLAYNFDFSPDYPVLLLVLWALGACMIGLALLVWIPIRALTILSVAVIVLHNSLDRVDAARFGAAAGIWNLLHQPGAFRLAHATIIVGYPLVPWIAVMALGFCFGQLYLMDRAVRQRLLVVIGAVATLSFVVIRAFNVYGDPVPWATQTSAVYTALSFLNTTKYPPSLDFLLMTLGPALLGLAWLDRLGLDTSNPLVIFGRVPLFYFVLHFVSGTRSGGGARVAAVWGCRADLRIPSAAVDGRTAGALSRAVRLRLMGGVRRLGRGRAGALSGLSLVRGNQGDATRLVVALSLGHLPGGREPPRSGSRSPLRLRLRGKADFEIDLSHLAGRGVLRDVPGQV